MEKTEIKLTDKQFELLNSIQEDRKKLQEQAQVIFKELSKKESDLLIMLCESAGVEAVQGMELKEKSLFVPKQEVKAEELISDAVVEEVK